MQEHFNVVIIGGGIVGCSTAYHLAKLGVKEVVIIEKGELTSGSTWHAAGLVGQLRSSRNVTRMLTHSVKLYQQLEQETGQPTGWHQVGGLRLASSPERMIELKKAATTAKSFGLEMHLLSPEEAYNLFPIMSLENVIGAAMLPTDGYADPSMITNALAKGARDLGVKIKRHTRVLELVVKDRQISSVVTDHDTFKCDVLVNCGGMWAKEIGKMAGVFIPLIPVQHQYMVSEVIAGLPKNLPTMRDPDNLVYYKEEAGGLVMGGYEHNPIPWHTGKIPDPFGQELLQPNFDHFEPLAAKAIFRTPVLETVGCRKLINGPEAFTPDGHFIMGRAPELNNFYVACGFNAHGIAAGGGAGKMMAEWIHYGEPSLDLWQVDIRRFGKNHRNDRYVVDRTLELYGKHYSIAWPNEEHHSARGLKTSPLYPILKEQGAAYGSKFGWERPNYFDPDYCDPNYRNPDHSSKKDQLTFGRPAWADRVTEEHQAIREQVVLIDQTSFSKFEVKGKGALDYLNQLAVNEVNKPVGSLIYTQLCNERGGIEADLTICRLGLEHFYIVTGTAFATHDFEHFRRYLPKDDSVTLTDVTEQYAVINVCGPNARKLLQKSTHDSLANDDFKFATARVITIGKSAKVLALRLTYVGELGWELHIPLEQATYVYQLLWEHGGEFGIKNAGYRAIESCRLEKGYRYWSAELTADYNPYEAGLGFCVDLHKKDFLGRQRLTEIKKSGPQRKLLCFTIDQELQLYGGETICSGNRVLGVVTSGGYGYTVGKTIAYGYVDTQDTQLPEYNIQILGESYRADVAKKVLYDPERKKILN